jgi:hypothetical protein
MILTSRPAYPRPNNARQPPSMEPSTALLLARLSGRRACRNGRIVTVRPRGGEGLSYSPSGSVTSRPATVASSSSQQGLGYGHTELGQSREFLDTKMWEWRRSRKLGF